MRAIKARCRKQRNRNFFVFLFASPNFLRHNARRKRELNNMETLTNEEIEKLKSAKNTSEWNATCDEVKKAHGGYPSDWYATIVLSGLMADVSSKW